MPIIITALTITKARTSQHTIFLISPRATFCAIILYLEGHFNDTCPFQYTDLRVSDIDD
jgi:hypothetical protein